MEVHFKYRKHIVPATMPKNNANCGEDSLLTNEYKKEDAQQVVVEQTVTVHDGNNGSLVRQIFSLSSP